MSWANTRKLPIVWVLPLRKPGLQTAAWQLLAGLLFSTVYVVMGHLYFHEHRFFTIGQRMGFVLHWAALPALVLIIAIINVAVRRSKDNPFNAHELQSPEMQLATRFLTNTVEQLLLASIVWLGLAAFLPHSGLQLVPVLTTLFVVGRMAFYIGYRIRPVWRYFGYAVTFLPTIVGCFYLVYRLFI